MQANSVEQVKKIMLEKFGVQPRMVDVDDSEFILSLRLNPVLGQYLSATDNNLEKQIEWINLYKQREQRGEEYYFIFVNATTGERFGTGRIYNIEKDAFTGGSWLFKSGSPEGLAVLSDVFGRDFGFDVLKKNIDKFDVRKNNNKVLRYQRLFRPKLIAEDERNNFYAITKEEYQKTRNIIIQTFI